MTRPKPKAQKSTLGPSEACPTIRAIGWFLHTQRAKTFRNRSWAPCALPQSNERARPSQKSSHSRSRLVPAGALTPLTKPRRNRRSEAWRRTPKLETCSSTRSPPWARSTCSRPSTRKEHFGGIQATEDRPAVPRRDVASGVPAVPRRDVASGEPTVPRRDVRRVSPPCRAVT